MEDDKTVLIAIMNSKRDFEIANTQNWYRIPVKSAPSIVINNTIKTIAFYFTEEFEDEKYCIRYYATVKNVSIVKRKELLPNEINDKKAENEYYKIEFAPLIKLSKLLKNQTGKRIIFIVTSLEKFNTATEIKHLFDHNEAGVVQKKYLVPDKYSNTVLVAILKSIRDLEIAKTQNWYRIPFKSAPEIVRTGQIKIIAFYHPKVFKEEKYSIRYYASVKNISIVKRKELLADESDNINADKDYFKIEIGPLTKLEAPIKSQRGRRIVFIPTSKEKFFSAKEINHLFNGTILEEVLWRKLTENNIAAEREFFYEVDKHYFFLDFAIFCKTRNIDVEVDGDEFHTGKPHVQYDKKRNNLLESEGWSVLRFTWNDLNHQLDESVKIICKTIMQYGGFKGFFGSPPPNPCRQGATSCQRGKS